MNWHEVTNVLRDTKVSWAGALGGITLTQVNEVLSAISFAVAIAYTVYRFIKEVRKDKGEKE
jgi:hypothetical protein